MRPATGEPLTVGAPEFTGGNTGNTGPAAGAGNAGAPAGVSEPPDETTGAGRSGPAVIGVGAVSLTVAGVPVTYPDSGQRVHWTSLVHLDGKLAEPSCWEPVAGQGPPLTARRYNTPPRPRIAIQYAVPRLTGVGWILTEFHPPALGDVVDPDASREPGRPRASE